MNHVFEFLKELPLGDCIRSEAHTDRSISFSSAARCLPETKTHYLIGDKAVITLLCLSFVKKWQLRKYISSIWKFEKNTGLTLILYLYHSYRYSRARACWRWSSGGTGRMPSGRAGRCTAPAAVCYEHIRVCRTAPLLHMIYAHGHTLLTLTQFMHPQLKALTRCAWAQSRFQTEPAHAHHIDNHTFMHQKNQYNAYTQLHIAYILGEVLELLSEVLVDVVKRSHEASLVPQKLAGHIHQIPIVHLRGAELLGELLNALWGLHFCHIRK